MGLLRRRNHYDLLQEIFVTVDWGGKVNVDEVSIIESKLAYLYISG